jgi:hypothetical protein
MSDQYRVKPGARPDCVGQSDHDGAGSARLFLCAGCRAQALIWSCCDRGQIYCAGDCGSHARRRDQRAAGARYQAKVGFPLLVQRRCAEPVFSISNHLAYSGQMVHAAASRPSAIRDVLGASHWIDVQPERLPGSDADGLTGSE